MKLIYNKGKSNGNLVVVSLQASHIPRSWQGSPQELGKVVGSLTEVVGDMVGSFLVSVELSSSAPSYRLTIPLFSS